MSALSVALTGAFEECVPVESLLNFCGHFGIVAVAEEVYKHLLRSAQRTRVKDEVLCRQRASFRVAGAL